MVFPLSKSILSVLIKQHCALLRLYKLMMNKWEWSVSMCMEWQWHGKTEVLAKKCVLVSLCPPQIPHWLVLEWNCALSVRMPYATSHLVWIFNFSSSLYKFIMDVLHYSIKLHLSCCTLMWCAVVPDVVTCHSQMEAHCL